MLGPDDRPVHYVRDGAFIFTSIAPITLRYVVNFDGVSGDFQFPDDFAEVCACYLAADICVALTQNQSLRDTYLQQYTHELSNARHSGATEREAVVITGSTWLDARDHGLETDPRLRGLSGIPSGGL